MLFLFVVWQCLHHLVNVYLQLLIGLDDVRFYALLNCVAYACAALAFRPLIEAYGLGGAAIALSVGTVVNAIGAAPRLALDSASDRLARARPRRRDCCRDHGGRRAVSGLPELSTCGISLRVAYLVTVSLLLWMTMSAAERPGFARGGSREHLDEVRYQAMEGARRRQLDGVAEVRSPQPATLRAGGGGSRVSSGRSRDRVLDVGTGTGLLPFSLARAAEPAASILGIDISAGMIETARRRLRDELRDDPRVRFERMDAEHLQLPERASMSCSRPSHSPTCRAPSSRCVRFSVLAPGGRLGIALGSRPPVGSGAQLRHAVAEVGRRIEVLRGRRLTADLLDRIVDRRIGRSVDVPEGAPLATQLNRVPLLRTLVRGAGFTDVEVSWRNYQNEIESAEEFWDLHRTIRSDSRKRLLVAPAGVEQGVRREFMDECRKTLERGGVMTFPISVVFVTARKPARAS